MLTMQSAVLATAIPSVRPSVRHMLVPYPDESITIGSRGLHCEVAKKHSSFLMRTMNEGRRPLPPKIFAQSDSLSLKSSDFDQYLLITSHRKS